MVHPHPATSAAGLPTPHPVWLSLLLHLAPGALAAAAYFSLVPVVVLWGLPSVAALSLSAFVAVAPVQIGILLAHRHRHPAGGPAVWLRSRPGARTTAVWTVAIVVSAGAVFAVTSPFSGWVETAAFGWWPPSWKVGLGTGGGYSRPALAGTAAMLLVGTVIVAPVVEECYFRGFLLPRMPAKLGPAAPVAHAVLFAAYHLWTPWLLPTRVLAILPLVYAVRRTGSVSVGIAAHVTLNAVDLFVVLLAVLAL